MSNKFHQISFKEIFSDCQDIFIDDAPSFFDLLEECINTSSFIPDSFFNAFYHSLGRKRVYPHTGFLSALTMQKFFQYLQIQCLSFSSISVMNFETYVDLPKFPMLRYLSASNRISFRLLKTCLLSLWTLPNQSARLHILPCLICLPSICQGLSFMLPRTILNP